MDIDDAINHFGSKSALADAAEVEPPSVSLWVKNKRIPYLSQLWLEQVTEGKLRAERFSSKARNKRPARK